MCPSSSLCDPGIQSHSFDICPILLLRLSRRGPEEKHRGLLSSAHLAMEVRTPTLSLDVVPVAAFERASVAAEAVDGRAALASCFHPQGTRVGDRNQTLSLEMTPRAKPSTDGSGSAAITVWRCGLGLDVDVGVCVDRQGGALRNWAHRPGEIKQKNKKVMTARRAQSRFVKIEVQTKFHR